MRTNLLALLFLVLTSTAAHAEPWTRLDSAIEATVLASLAVDYVQTVRICRDPIIPTHEETNPVMGTRGDRVPPEAYFATVAVAHVIAARVLPQPWRGISQGVVLSFQARSIAINWEAGYAVRF